MYLVTNNRLLYCGQSLQWTQQQVTVGWPAYKISKVAQLFCKDKQYFVLVVDGFYLEIRNLDVRGGYRVWGIKECGERRITLIYFITGDLEHTGGPILYSLPNQINTI